MSKPKHKPLFSFKYFVYDFAKITGGIPALILHRPKYIYENKNAKKKIRGGALLISNHIGFIDPILVMEAVWYRRHNFVCIKDFFEKKCGWFFKKFGCIPIDKTNFGMDSFRDIVSHLSDGCLVSMFPEGGVNTKEQLETFKSGMVLMAVQSKKPIVPICIKKRNHWYNRYHIAIGEPISTTESMDTLNFSKINDITNALYQKEIYLQNLLEE